MKSASAYVLKDRIIVHPKSQTKAGLWVADEPYFKLSVDARQDEIVNAILKSLELGKKAVPNPTDWSGFEKKQLEGLGLTSWTPISQKDTKHCAIALRDGILSFVPTKHDPERAAGFLHKEGQSVSISHKAPVGEIYSLFKLAVDRCE
jgi:hypothetical protein